MKLTEYPATESLKPEDILLTDGVSGTKKILAKDAIFALLNNIPEMHRNIFRGKNLGGSFTTTQKTAIADGTFNDIWVGDYWEVSGVKWRVADINYWKAPGSSSLTDNHVCVIPDSHLYLAPMNSTPTADGGYAGSTMSSIGIGQAVAKAKSAFGSSNVKTVNAWLVHAVVNGMPTGVTAKDFEALIPSETMVYGTKNAARLNVSGAGTESMTYARDTYQLALMRVANQFIASSSGTQYWLRDTVSSTMYAINTGGTAYAENAASTVTGVRPVVTIG